MILEIRKSVMSSQTKELFNNIIIYIHRYYLPSCYVVSNVGNLLSIFIFLKRSWRKNVCVFYLLVCLVINLGYTQSSILPMILNNNLKINLQNSNRLICKIFYYVSYVFSRYLPTILIFASIDRLLISSQNVDTRLYSSRRLAYFSVGINSLFWLIYYVHILVKVNIIEMYPNVFACYYDLSENYIYFLKFSTVVINLSSTTVLIILFILTFKNVRQIQSVPRQQRQQIRTMTKKDFQLLRCLYAYNIAYVIFSSPSAIFGAYTAIRTSPDLGSFQSVIENFVSPLCVCIYQISYCVGFFIFLSISKSFRQEIKRMFSSVHERTLAPTLDIEPNIAKRDPL